MERKEGIAIQTTASRSIDRNSVQDACRHYRVERQFSSKRHIKELVRDLLRAHSGK